MKNLLVLFSICIMLMSCEKSAITPNTTTTTTTNTNSMGYKDVIVTILDENQDTLFKEVLNTDFQDRVGVFNEKNLSDTSLDYMRNSAYINLKNPAMICMAYNRDTLPRVVSTRTIGVARLLEKNFQVYCKIYESANIQWISTPDGRSNSTPKSNHITNVIDLGRHPVSLIYADLTNDWVIHSEVRNTPVNVYRISGEISTLFYRSDAPSIQKEFTVIYDIPLYYK